MINLDGDSSEEDEQIDDTGINNGPELLKEPATSILGKRALLLTEEVEEEDEPMIDNRIPQLLSLSKFGETETMDLTASPEFVEARTAILEDPWDVSSWMIYLEEIENHHGGSTSFESACMEFLQYFPRCAKIWQKLGEYFSNAGDFQEAEKFLLNGAKQCWSVELWVYLLSFMINQSSLSQPNDDELASAVARCENAFELSLSQVGLAIDSYDIWKLYVEFVSEWPSNNALDRSKKVSTLRKIYQRVLCTAIDQLDEFWNAYKAFERDVNGDQAEAYFGELNRRLGHSRTILKDRKEKIKQISFDRFSTPPTNSSSELEQLERWSQWMSYEMGIPDYLNSESYKPMVRMVFQQCLSCFYYHAEVWLAFANFEQRILSGTEPSEVRSILKQGISAVPDSAILRIRLAELEEQFGNMDAAKEVLREMFEKFHDGFSFTLYQRFVHRTVGIDAARRLFSETQELRTNNPTLSIELYIAHATTELEMNSSPSVSLRVLNLAKSKHREVIGNIRFLKLYTRVLIQLGDINQIRWILRLALEEMENECLEDVGSKSDAIDIATSTKKFRQQRTIATEDLNLRKQYELLQEFIIAETTLGQSTVQNMLNLREKRQQIKNALDEVERTKFSGFPGFREAETKGNIRKELFDCACEVLDRYTLSPLLQLPEADRELKDRCFERSSVDVISGRVIQSRDSKNMSSEFHLSLSGLPVILRDFLTQLPPNFGGQPDYDGFIRHMKTVILPPRPQVSQLDLDPAISTDERRGANVDEDDEHISFDGESLETDVFRLRHRYNN